MPTLRKQKDEFKIEGNVHFSSKKMKSHKFTINNNLTSLIDEFNNHKGVG